MNEIYRNRDNKNWNRLESSIILIATSLKKIVYYLTKNQKKYR